MAKNKYYDEAKNELDKKPIQQIADLIEEVNSISTDKGEDVRKNIDRLKHIIKRIGFQQAAIDYKASKTNKYLIVLSVIAAIPAVEVVVRFVKYLFELCK